MSDLIDRRDAIDAAIEAADEWDGGMNSERAKIIGKAILNLPAVQPQPEIIRCKDCKHWGKRGLCEIWDYYISNEDFYCGCAGRRTDE